MRMYILVMLASMSLLATAEPFPSEPHIIVSGIYKITVAPDILRMSLSITETGQDVAPVSRMVEQRSAKLIKSMKGLGVDKKDISSSHLRIVPHYNWQNREQVYIGTEVSRNIEIVLRDLGQYDDLIRTVLDARVGQINNTRLESSKELKIRKEALQGAVEDARTKAELLVSNIPEKIGAVYSISQVSAGPVISHSRLSYQAAESTDTAFEPGVIEFSESVTVIYYLSK